MNSTDSQTRIAKLEADNRKLVGMINTISTILSRVADTSDPVVSRLLQGLDLSIGTFR